MVTFPFNKNDLTHSPPIFSLSPPPPKKRQKKVKVSDRKQVRERWKWEREAKRNTLYPFLRGGGSGPCRSLKAPSKFDHPCMLNAFPKSKVFLNCTVSMGELQIFLEKKIEYLKKVTKKIRIRIFKKQSQFGSRDFFPSDLTFRNTTIRIRI